jgi:hypothetical protein
MAVLSVVLLFLFFAQREKWTTAISFLFIAIFAKWYAGVLMLPSLLRFYNRREFDLLVRTAIIGLSMFIILCGPFLWADYPAFLKDLSWEALRPVEEWERGLFSSMFPFALGLLCFLIHEYKSFDSFRNIVKFGGISIFMFIAFQRVYHLNHLIWVIPFMCLWELAGANPSGKDKDKCLRIENFMRNVFR